MTGEVKSGTRRTDAGARSRSILIAVVAALACGAIATAAPAQDDPPVPTVPSDPTPTVPDPGGPGEFSDAQQGLVDAGSTCAEQSEAAGQGTIGCDTDYTPIAKESGPWSLIQGARYDQAGPETKEEFEARSAELANSAQVQVTSFDDELTDVAFTNQRNGFAAGQRKLDCDEDGEPDTYVPVIYRYGDSPIGLRWHSTSDGGILGSCDRPGFVGSVVWIRATGMALAVGGTGSYPFREPAYGRDVNGNPCEPDSAKPYAANCDQAGLGRAWLYNHGRWSELQHDPETFPEPSGPSEWDGVRGMTALDFSPLPGKNFGFAGGLGQIWPIRIQIEGQDGPCPANAANACVSFPADGKLPEIGNTDARAEMNSSHYTSPGLAGVGQKDTTNTVDDFRFRGRVRQIRMAVNSNNTDRVQAAAVTDGCCAGLDTGTRGASLGPAHNYPAILDFLSNSAPRHTGTDTTGLEDSGWHWRVYSADLYAQQYEHAAYLGVPDEQRRALRPPNRRQDLPDSFYSLMFRPDNSGERVSLIATPGGPAPAGGGDRPSVVTEPFCLVGDAVEARGLSLPVLGAIQLIQPAEAFTALRAQTSSVRLVDGDGDDDISYTSYAWIPLVTAGLSPSWPPLVGTPSQAGRTAPHVCRQGTESRSPDAPAGSSIDYDAVPDWAVGQLNSTQGPFGARGLAFCTVCRPTAIPDTVNAGLSDRALVTPSTGTPENPVRTGIDTSQITGDPANYRPTSPEKLAGFLQSQYSFTGSYGLNALDYLDGIGTGWGVGAHGGIVELGGSDRGSLGGGKAEEPDPPRLGAHTPARAPDRAPYQGFDTQANPPGAVPSLATRPLQTLSQPALSWAGTPGASPDYGARRNGLGQIVMSRDGAEGWGLDRSLDSSGAWAMTLFHYQGGHWTRCDPEGVDKVIPADPACSALAPLRDYSFRGQIRGVRVTAAARIPYEADSDPTNDDEFGVLALATGYGSSDSQKVPPTLLRYAEGRWRLETDPQAQDFLDNHLDFDGAFAWQNRFRWPVQMVFSSASDGWILQPPSRGSGGSVGEVTRLLHFDGSRWIDCTTDEENPDGSGVSDSTGAMGGASERRSWCEDPAGLTISADQQTSGTSQTPLGQTSVQDTDHLVGMATAGDTLYLYGSRTVRGAVVPLILCKRAGGPWQSEGCGLDPGLPARRGGPDPSVSGEVTALSVAPRSDDAPRAWAALGSFDPPANPRDTNLGTPTSTSLLRLDGSDWEPFDDRGPLADRLQNLSAAGRQRVEIVAQSDGGGLIAAEQPANGFALYRFDLDRASWELLPADLVPDVIEHTIAGSSAGSVSAITPDNQGGVWLGVQSFSFVDDILHYTASPPKAVFTEAPSPLRDSGEAITGLAGGPNGSLWATTAGPYLYRYQRTTGWDRVQIPGWTRGLVTFVPPAHAVAVNESGEGVVVGRDGRIAEISGDSVQLDRAAGTVCDQAQVEPPCGTSRHLRSASVATDGAAMVGGDRLSLLWRPPGGDFQAIPKPEAPPSATITGVSLPSANLAYLTTSSGQLFRGTGTGASWSWTLENTDASDALITRDPSGAGDASALNAVAVGASGHGYAAGADGILLERIGLGSHPWRRLASPVSDELTAIALRGDDALIGGANGLILTGSGPHFHVAREPDQFAAATGPVIGMAVGGGRESGDSEAWAATADKAGGPYGNLVSSQLFHYASNDSDPLLDATLSRTEPLPDSPARRPGETAFAALGKSDCHRSEALCPAVGVVGADYAALARRTAEQIATGGQTGIPALTVLTGDAVDDAGMAGAAEADQGRGAPTTGLPAADAVGPGHVGGALKLRAMRGWIGDPLAQADVPLFAAIGGQDLSGYRPCTTSFSCAPTGSAGRAANDAWRAAFGAEVEPWGTGEEGRAGDYAIRPVPDSSSAVRTDGAPQAGVRLGSASTHYAFDLVDSDGKAVARFVFADTALRSLSASDPMQNPTEPSGQLAWIDRMLCREGGSATDGSACTRGEDQAAVLVTNTPTYSYGPGALTDTNTVDGSQLEGTLLRNHASAVVTGRLGWNGLYYLLGAGGQPVNHFPAAGGTYPAAPPDPLPGGDPPIPFAVASGAGGKFGPDGRASGSATEGYWHGHTVIRLASDGDPTETIVEQRPILDLLSLTADTHTVRAGRKLSLHGMAREPLVYDSSSSPAPHTARFNEVSGPAITHRFELLAADPDEPWLAQRDQGSSDDASEARSLSSDRLGESDPCGPYLCLSSNVGTIDDQSGQVKAGNGQYPRTFAIAELSVGEHSTTYPLVFEPRASFKTVPPPPPPPVAVPAPASPPAPTQPTAPSVNLPAAPVLPVLTAQALAPPPVPPSPPTFASEAPLDLNLSPAALDVTPPTAVSQPPTPPVNPAPPSGARREARQRQAAAQKSGADSDATEEGGDGQAADLADSPPSAHGSSSATRHELTAIAEREQPSAWARDALLGGGLGVAALVLALGTGTARPTPRRSPEVPAPAWARAQRRPRS